MDYKIRFSPNETDTDALMRSFLTQGYAVRRVASKDIFNIYKKMENRPRIELDGHAACFELSDFILSTSAGGKAPMFIIEDLLLKMRRTARFNLASSQPLRMHLPNLDDLLRCRGTKRLIPHLARAGGPVAETMNLSNIMERLRPGPNFSAYLRSTFQPLVLNGSFEKTVPVLRFGRCCPRY
jgi:hypothetical protein